MTAEALRSDTFSFRVSVFSCAFGSNAHKPALVYEISASPMPTNSYSRVLRKRRRDKSARERNEFSHGRAPHEFGLLLECTQSAGNCLGLDCCD